MAESLKKVASATLSSAFRAGRPKIAANIRELARDHTQEAVDALVAALASPGERVPAARVLLAYGYGTPIQTHNVRKIESIEDLTDEELISLIEEVEQSQETKH